MELEYNNLSTEEKETVKEMVQYCLHNCVRLGMDEGFDSDGNPTELRKNLSKFSDYNHLTY